MHAQAQRTTRQFKRILALDGGGIRGVFSLQILARIEQLLREERGNPDLVLADEFDFFAGTSTGAIIAAFLAWGLPVRRNKARSKPQDPQSIEELYLTQGVRMFAKETWYRRWKAKYGAEAITQFFREFFCEDAEGKVPALLGSKRLRTKLLIVVRDASTGSPWPISNNPAALFNQPGPECNLEIPLWKLLRASTAAPAFFRPQEISIGSQQHLFVDGGITPYNNPAVIAVLMAILPSYRLGWKATPDSLHVVSIGTGTVLASLPPKVAEKIHMLDQLRFVIPALLGSVAWEQDLICRVLGDCVHGAPLDWEIGALNSPCLLGPGTQNLFTYVRYDQVKKPSSSGRSTPFAQEALPGDAGLNVDLEDSEERNPDEDDRSGLADESQEATESNFIEPPRPDIRLDDVSQIPELIRAGAQYAREHVRREHLYPRSLDIKPRDCLPCGCPVGTVGAE